MMSSTADGRDEDSITRFQNTRNGLYHRKLDECIDSDASSNLKQLPEDTRDDKTHGGILRGGKEHASFDERGDDTDDATPVAPEGDGLAKEGTPFVTSEDFIVTKDGDLGATVAGIAGNILEWYDFAVFGFLSKTLGQLFFPPPSENGDDDRTVDAFIVFGGAFLMRPVGGILLGYVGDKYGRKKALIISIFLMAFPTFAMGCLPTYKQVGTLAVVLLIFVRLLQGLSVGGQLVSLVFTLENRNPRRWGLFGSFVMAGANFGTLLGGLVGFTLRASLSEQQLLAWGWRIPFLFGIVVSFAGFYLRSHGEDDDQREGQATQNLPNDTKGTHSFDGDEIGTEIQSSETPKIRPGPFKNPVKEAFCGGNLRSLLAAALVPMLWSAGFYLSFVWMATYMSDLGIPGAFAINSASLFLSVCLLFPVAGILSDQFGRRRIMTIGGATMALLPPFIIYLIRIGNPAIAFAAQSCLGVALSFWGSPMCAWLVEGFEPTARLTSVAIGYNIAQAIAGGSAPALASILADEVGGISPGYLVTTVAVIALIGLWAVAPKRPGSHEALRKGNFASVPTDPSEGSGEGSSSNTVADLELV